MAIGCVGTLATLQRAVVKLRLRALANLRSCMISAGYTEF